MKTFALPVSFLFFLIAPSLASASQRAELIDEVRQEFRTILAELDKMDGPKPDLQISGFNTSTPSPQSVSVGGLPRDTQFGTRVDEVERDLLLIQSELEAIDRPAERIPEVSIPSPFPLAASTPESVSEGGPGFYLIPSLSLVHSNGFEWQSILGVNYGIKEKLGGAGGLRAGLAWEHFFADLQLTYAHSDLDSMELGGLPLSFSGDSRFFGFHLTGGGKVDLLDSLSLPFGIGLGGGSQEISILLGGAPFSERDFLLSYDLFAGLEYSATEHAVLGLRYRLISVADMESFSGRELQLLEFSFGYQY